MTEAGSVAVATEQLDARWQHRCMQQWPSLFADHGGETDQQICSAKGCQQTALYTMVWNNPKVHTPEREKTWLACEQHRDWLSSFLEKREFLLRVEDM